MVGIFCAYINLILMMAQYPIGVFDSGYGGLTVLKEFARLLPENDFIYLGDNRRAPYGPLAFSTVYEYTLESIKWFADKGCRLVIVACNTASAKALRSIQQNDLPGMTLPKRVLGVIRPTSEVIGSYSKSGHAGIMATSGTVLSNSYVLEIKKFFPEMQISQEACPEWVSLVEAGKHESEEADKPVKDHIEKLLAADRKIDTILLACTHYPLLMDKIRKHAPENISVIAQGTIVAESLVSYLEKHPEIANECSKCSRIQFFTTGDTGDFNAHASIFFGNAVNATTAVLNSGSN